MPPTTRGFQSNYFAIEIDGVTLTFFTEVGGLGIEFNVASEKMGSIQYKLFEPKLPAGQVNKELTLKRGVTTDRALQDWIDDVFAGKIGAATKTIGVGVYDTQMSKVTEFSLTNCIPKSLKMGDLNATGKEILIEEMTIVYETLDWT
jgi:phage tail-like protein